MVMYGRQPTVQDFRRLVVLELLRLYSYAPWPTLIRTGSLLEVGGCRFLLVAFLCASQICIRSWVFERITSGYLATLLFLRHFRNIDCGARNCGS